MHTVRSAVAVLALVSGAVAIASGEAWARDPDRGIPVERSAVDRSAASAAAGRPPSRCNPAGSFSMWNPRVRC